MRRRSAAAGLVIRSALTSSSSSSLVGARVLAARVTQHRTGGASDRTLAAAVVLPQVPRARLRRRGARSFRARHQPAGGPARPGLFSLRSFTARGAAGVRGALGGTARQGARARTGCRPRRRLHHRRVLVLLSLFFPAASEHDLKDCLRAEVSSGSPETSMEQDYRQR